MIIPKIEDDKLGFWSTGFQTQKRPRAFKISARRPEITTSDHVRISPFDLLNGKELLNVT